MTGFRLPPATVAGIREELAAGRKHRAIAAKYRVGAGTVSRIQNNVSTGAVLYAALESGRFVKVSTAARLLNKNVSSLYRLISKKRIPVSRIEGVMVISRATIRRLAS